MDYIPLLTVSNQHFSSFTKKRQKFIIFKTIVATYIFLEFQQKYEILKRNNLDKDIRLVDRLIFTYYYLFCAVIALY